MFQGERREITLPAYLFIIFYIISSPVTTKFVVTTVMMKLVLTAVMTKLVVTAVTTKLVISAYF